MKATTFFKTIVLASIFVFAIGCGKDNSSGGYGYNMPVSNGLSQGGLNAQQSFRQWYESNQEPSHIYGQFKISKSVNVSTAGAPNSGNCRQEPIKIFGKVVGYYTVCTQAGNTTEGSGNVVNCRVSIMANNNNNNAGQIKSNNPILRKLYTGGAGVLVDGYDNGQIIVLAFQESNGSVSSYQINRSYHSAFQPLATQTNTKFEQVLQITQDYGTTQMDSCY